MFNNDSSNLIKIDILAYGSNAIFLNTNDYNNFQDIIDNIGKDNIDKDIIYNNKLKYDDGLNYKNKTKYEDDLIYKNKTKYEDEDDVLSPPSITTLKMLKRPSLIYSMDTDNINEKENNKIMYDNYNDFLEEINEKIKKLEDFLYLISVKYDTVVIKYNILSISIIVISSLITVIQAIKLTTIQYIKNINQLTNRRKNISSCDVISNQEKANDKTLLYTFITDIFVLLLGSVIITVSSIIRFYEYREVMERLKNTQIKISSYLLLYNKEKKQLLLYKNNKENYDTIRNNIDEYNNSIKEEFNEHIEFRHTNLIKLYDIKYRDDVILREKKKDANIRMMSIKCEEKKRIYEIKNDMYNFYRSYKLLNYNSNIITNNTSDFNDDFVYYNKQNNLEYTCSV